jgi:hypothetical protein
VTDVLAPLRLSQPGAAAAVIGATTFLPRLVNVRITNPHVQPGPV